jgi:hypothetical protein
MMIGTAEISGYREQISFLTALAQGGLIDFESKVEAYFKSRARR